MNKTALITGITGQDGSYLAELLLNKGYRVLGLIRKTSNPELKYIKHIQNQVELTYGDLLDSVSLVNVLSRGCPDEVYNLASQSYPGESWRIPIQTAEITALGAHRLFEAVRQLCPQAKVYQASSSEMFGYVREIPQNEMTPFNPANPYAACKLYAHNMAHIYRDSYKMFIACGILFNHESPRRGINFITRKVTIGAACIKLGIKNAPVLNEEGEPLVKNGKLHLGNLQAKRDWGFAGDYVEAMWRMMQLKKADDFVVATGETHTIKDLCAEAFGYLGLDWQKSVVVDKRFVRPTETGPLIGDSAKAKKVLKWEPKVRFKQLVRLMTDAALAELK